MADGVPWEAFDMSGLGNKVCNLVCADKRTRDAVNASLDHLKHGAEQSINPSTGLDTLATLASMATYLNAHKYSGWYDRDKTTHLIESCWEGMHAFDTWVQQQGDADAKEQAKCIINRATSWADARNGERSIRNGVHWFFRIIEVVLGL